jgi:hypothetical protein
MDGKAKWVDNTVAKRWSRSLKSECVRINEYKALGELKKTQRGLTLSSTTTSGSTSYLELRDAPQTGIA